MSLLRRSSSLAPAIASRPEVRALVGEARLELVPMKSVDQAIADLPEGSRVSVTCSPVKGLATTQDLTARLVGAGHDVVPHLAARLVDGPEHVARLAAWIRFTGLSEVFVVAGDAEQPVGPYDGAVGFLRELLEHDTGLRHVGVTAYPDGHTLLDQSLLRPALLAKQELLAQAGVSSSATTQMCFDSDKVMSWLADERAAGLTMPVLLGLPGVVDRARLMTLGVRLGIGASLRFLSKNKTSMIRMFAPGGYDPTDLVADIADRAETLGIVGLHSFTFNSVADTVAWQRSILAD